VQVHICETDAELGIGYIIAAIEATRASRRPVLGTTSELGYRLFPVAGVRQSLYVVVVSLPVEGITDLLGAAPLLIITDPVRLVHRRSIVLSDEGQLRLVLNIQPSSRGFERGTGLPVRKRASSLWRREQPSAMQGTMDVLQRQVLFAL
jgi:hypothetical protein